MGDSKYIRELQIKIDGLERQLKARDKQFTTLHNAVRTPYKSIIDENTQLRGRIKDMEALIKEAYYYEDLNNTIYPERRQDYINRLKAMNEEINEKAKS